MAVINVFSEIGKLKTVLLHRPGAEVENLTPELLETLLFDDIPYQKVAQQEHDYFKKLLIDNGVEVLYIEDLVTATLNENPTLKQAFIEQFIKEAKIKTKYLVKYRSFLNNLNNTDLVKNMIAGTQKKQLGVVDNDYPFVANPLPNILFQRDPFASIGIGVSLNKMWSKIRNRETIFPDFVFKHNKKFKDEVIFYSQRTDKNHIEGGDILILNEQTLIVGLSQRTEMKAIKNLAANILNDELTSFNKIVVIDLPKTRSFMHLDTVFSHIDYDKFIVHPLIFRHLTEFKIWEITKSGKTKIKQDLKTYLSQLIKKKITLIECGGDDPVASQREQWNDGTNVLVLEPGKVIAYERNHVTIKLLKANGVTVLAIPSSELSKGRGGPRCMSMPLYRDNIK